MQTQTCTKCGEEKALTEFHKNKKGKYGVTSVCKNCKNEYDKKYYQRPEVQERIKEYNRKPEVMERKRDHTRKYSQRPEIKARRKEYFNRPDVKARQREYKRRPERREYELKLKKERYAMGLDARKHVEVPTKHATRSGLWSDAEVQFLMTSELSLVDIALELGRTYHSVHLKRARLRKKLEAQQ